MPISTSAARTRGHLFPAFPLVHAVRQEGHRIAALSSVGITPSSGTATPETIAAAADFNTSLGKAS
jgi:UDP:flavonoid glycosyltransferase YjiC (YdhE family)